MFNQYNITPTMDTHDMDIMNRIIMFTNSVIQSRTKTLLIRVDFTYPEGEVYPDNNTPLQRCMDSFMHYGKRHGLSPHYFWVRERSMESTNNTHHYHAFILLNGSAIQNPYKILQKLTMLWGRALGNIDASGLVHYCKHNLPDHPNPYAIQIRRTDPNLDAVKQQVWNWLQYLAKLYSKQGVPYRQKSFSSSRL